MNEPKKSDMGIVAEKPANKGAQATAESVERRPMTNGNSQGQSTGRTQSRATVAQAVERIRQFVRKEPQEKLTTLLLLRCAPRAEVGCRIDDAECGGGRSVPSACLERNGGTAERRPDESG